VTISAILWFVAELARVPARPNNALNSHEFSYADVFSNFSYGSALNSHESSYGEILANSTTTDW